MNFSGATPALRALISMGVPWVSSAQMKMHSWPCALMARTKMSVCTASTRWPRWMLPFAYGSAMVTSMREAIWRRSLAHLAGGPARAAFQIEQTPLWLPAADLDQQALHAQARVGAVLQLEIRLGAADQRMAPEGARPAPGPLVSQPGGEGMRDLLLLPRQLLLELRKELRLVLVVA